MPPPGGRGFQSRDLCDHTHHRVEVSSEDSVLYSEELVERAVEVEGLHPHTHYSISLSVKFEGGDSGPPLFLATTTPEDGEIGSSAMPLAGIHNTALLSTFTFITLQE